MGGGGRGAAHRTWSASDDCNSMRSSVLTPVIFPQHVLHHVQYIVYTGFALCRAFKRLQNGRKMKKQTSQLQSNTVDSSET